MTHSIKSVLFHLAMLVLVTQLLMIPPKVCGQDSKPFRYENKEKGLRLELPDSNWKVTDQSTAAVTILLFSPDANFAKRATILIFPKAVVPDGMTTRQKQLQNAIGKAYEGEELKEVRFQGHDSRLLIYTAANTKTMEWGWTSGDLFFLFQLSARQSTWEDEAEKNRLLAIADTLETNSAKSTEVKIEHDRSLPKDVRERRLERLANREYAYQVEHHDLTVKISPAENPLEAKDVLTIKANEENTSSIELLTSLVDVISVEGDRVDSWSVEDRTDEKDGEPVTLGIRLKEPLAEDETTTIEIVTRTEKYLQETSQTLVAEIAILGQITEESSFSSHVLYYPIDELNRCSARISLTVPEEYTAITGGEQISETVTDGWKTTVFDNPQKRRRLLPFGFAVGKYQTRSVESKAGLKLTVYGFEGEMKLIQQRLDVLEESAHLFENMMGPLPWNEVRFAHVSPIRKETGVSLPGLIIVSDAFFNDLESVDLSDGNINSSEALGLLVIADELSHQWNIYLANLPNELGEGVSTFTNLLLVKSRHGEPAYLKGLELCKEAYQASTAVARDVAIADPLVYSTDAYRGIVFCKTPIVLEQLRRQIGDDNFSTAWRLAFNQFDDSKDGFDVLRDAVNKVTGENYDWYFDQWFFQAGWPKVKVEFAQAESNTKVIVQQADSREAYRFEAIIDLTGADGEKKSFKVEVDQAEQVFEVATDFTVTDVSIAPTHVILFEQVE